MIAPTSGAFSNSSKALHQLHQEAPNSTKTTLFSARATPTAEDTSAWAAEGASAETALPAASTSSPPSALRATHPQAAATRISSPSDFSRPPNTAGTGHVRLYR